MRSRLFGWVAVGVAAGTVATVLAGCAGGDSDPAPAVTFENHGSALADYEAATAEYSLPDGQTYPAAPFTDEQGSYESGYGESVVVTLWNCAWAREYLALRGVDDAAAADALDEFASIVDLPAFDLYFDPVSAPALFASAIEAARLGDPSGVQSIVDGGCPA